MSVLTFNAKPLYPLYLHTLGIKQPSASTGGCHAHIAWNSLRNGMR